MKKIFYSVLVLAGFSFSIDSNAQCTPDATLTDIITNPTGSSVNGDTVWLPPVTGPGYSSVFYLNIPSSIEVNPTITADVNWFKLDSLNGLPAGLDFQCSAGATDCQYNAGEAGCIEIFGDAVAPATANTTYILDLQFKGNVTILGSNQTLDNNTLASVTGDPIFAIRTEAGISIEELGFSSETKLAPNPSQGISTLSFTSKESKDLTISIVDVQGRAIAQQSVKTLVGDNNFDIDVTGFTSGIYQVILSNSKGHHSMKLVVE